MNVGGGSSDRTLSQPPATPSASWHLTGNPADTTAVLHRLCGADALQGHVERLHEGTCTGFRQHRDALDRFGDDLHRP